MHHSQRHAASSHGSAMAYVIMGRPTPRISHISWASRRRPTRRFFQFHGASRRRLVGRAMSDVRYPTFFPKAGQDDPVCTRLFMSDQEHGGGRSKVLSCTGVHNSVPVGPEAWRRSEHSVAVHRCETRVFLLDQEHSGGWTTVLL
jgi:hypothetical protein